MKMINTNYPCYFASNALQPNTDLKAMDKYAGEIATRVVVADSRDSTMRLARPLGQQIQCAN